MKSNWVDINEVSRLTGNSVEALRKAYQRGKLNVTRHRAGQKTVYRLDDILALIEKEGD